MKTRHEDKRKRRYQGFQLYHISGLNSVSLIKVLLRSEKNDSLVRNLGYLFSFGKEGVGLSGLGTEK